MENRGNIFPYPNSDRLTIHLLDFINGRYRGLPTFGLWHDNFVTGQRCLSDLLLLSLAKKTIYFHRQKRFINKSGDASTT